MVTLSDFKKLELRVGRIVDVQDHPNADKLYVLTVDIGETKKNVVAGVRAYYTRETLQGKVCILVNNLEAAIIRGVESQGMLLAAKDAENLSILTLEKDVALGSLVT